MGQKSSTETKRSAERVEEKCLICLELVDEEAKRLSRCGHVFHAGCIDRWFEVNDKCSCPKCGQIERRKKGSQPADGRMKSRLLPIVLPGFEAETYENEKERTIEILYEFPDGIQRVDHPRPGVRYLGTRRKAYLPNSNDGKEILRLLNEAFEDQQLFTISQSRTTGKENALTWNDIHHKTCITGGTANFGYPDPTYLFRVREELAQKGYRTPPSS